MHKTSRSLLPALLIACTAGAACAQSGGAVTRNLAEVKSGSYRLEHDHARVVWSISHHGFSTFSALFSTVQGTLKFDGGDPARSQLEATVDMNSVGTLLPAFDERLKGAGFFNTAKYPASTFRSTKIERVAANALRVTGELTFLGITRPAVLEATFNQAGSGGGGYTVGFDGKMTFRRSDFGMPVSSLGDEVTLTIEAEFQ